MNLPFRLPSLKRAPANLSAKRIPSLDGLRALSICAVMLAHASKHFTSTPLHAHFVEYGLAVLSYFGVTVFFVISGFLITTLLSREYETTSHVDLGRFYRRRAARILPASLFYVAIILILGHPSVIQSVVALTFSTTYFFADAYKPLQHLWSLSVEEQFYLLWPLIFATGMRNARRYCWLIVVLCPLVRFTLLRDGYSDYSHCAPAIADSLAAGCLLAFYQDRLRGAVNRYLSSTNSFLFLCLITVCTAFVLYRTNWVLLWGLVPGLIAVTTSAAIERRDPFLNSAPLVRVGLLSYSLYLWQQPFLVFDGPLNYFSARLALTFAVAYISYRFVEQPMLKFRAPKMMFAVGNAA